MVADFLSKRKKRTKVLITTYQSGKVVSEAAKKAGKTFDLGVYDEAHKTVGQKDKGFARLLYDENIKVEKRILSRQSEPDVRTNLTGK